MGHIWHNAHVYEIWFNSSWVIFDESTRVWIKWGLIVYVSHLTEFIRVWKYGLMIHGSYSLEYETWFNCSYIIFDNSHAHEIWFECSIMCMSKARGCFRVSQSAKILENISKLLQVRSSYLQTNHFQPYPTFPDILSSFLNTYRAVA